MIQTSEYLRKSIHFFNLIIPLTYLLVIPDKYLVVKLLSVFTLLFIFIDVGRHRIKWIRFIFRRWFNFMLRQHELEAQLTGASWVMIGALVTVLLFPRPVAILSLIFMSLGDLAAAMVGMSFGKHKIWEKSLEGFFGGLIVCIVIAWFYQQVPFPLGVAGALGAMVMELLPIPLDDNFKMPLGAGMTIMMFGFTPA
ncbi:MAG: diacylglycerol/polyprenol kinase family protein [Fidelibacterota bacterium]